MKAVLLLLLLCGCAHQPSGVGVLSVERFKGGTVIIASDARLKQEFRRYGGSIEVDGFMDKGRNILWVNADRLGRVDVKGRVLPDLDTLGHELMHHIRGAWHGPVMPKLEYP